MAPKKETSTVNETNIAVTQPSHVTEDEVRKFIVGQKTFERVTPQQIDMAIETANKKRRYITTEEELRECALLCQNCHHKAEYSPNMYEIITGVIARRKVKV
jgi:hypothetical protein